MKSKQLTLIIIGIFLLTFLVGNVNAEQQSLDSATQGECIELIQTCANCTFNNITSILYPNKTQDTTQLAMTKSGTVYNYSFCATSDSGTYIVSGFGDPDGTDDIWNYDFKITPNGEIASTASAFFYIGLLFMVFFGFVVIVYFGVTKESLPVKAFALGFGYLFLIALFFLAWRMSADFITSSSFLTNFFYWIFLVLTIGFFPFLLILFSYGVYMAITIKEIKSMIDSGIPESEAAERARWKK